MRDSHFSSIVDALTSVLDAVNDYDRRIAVRSSEWRAFVLAVGESASMAAKMADGLKIYELAQGAKDGGDVDGKTRERF
jgi:hypothetical protein